MNRSYRPTRVQMLWTKFINTSYEHCSSNILKQCVGISSITFLAQFLHFPCHQLSSTCLPWTVLDCQLKCSDSEEEPGTFRFVHVHKMTFKVHNFQINIYGRGYHISLQFEVSATALHFLCRFVHMPHIFRKWNICHIWLLLVSKSQVLKVQPVTA